MRYFLHLAYKGTKYRGWQSQPKARSVQEVLEKHISALLHQKKTVHPCGRTDAGVHASQFFAHLEVEQKIDFDLVFRINKLLPNDIAVYDLIKVEDHANAQLDAIRRTYQYYFHLDKNPFLEETSSWYDIENLDVKNMKSAVDLIKKYEDFRAMCLQPDAHNSTLCSIFETKLKVEANNRQFCFEITANRFLRGMIRLLVARIIEIGKGQLSLKQFQHALQTGERVQYHKSAHPQGLHLTKVVYPYLEMK